MKKPYSKPMATFEEYSLDMPIAAGCDPQYIDEAREFEEMGLHGLGFFSTSDGCSQFDFSGGDKLCYYTASSILFTS